MPIKNKKPGDGKRKLDKTCDALIKHLAKCEAEARGGNFINNCSMEKCIEQLDEAKEKQRLPFSEEDLLKDLTAHTAHADEQAENSPKERGE